MTEFTGTYYDGRSSKGHPVQVQVEPDGLALQYLSSEEDPGTVFWMASQIKPNAFREGDKTVLQYGEFPYQSLEVVSSTFAETIQKAYPAAVFHKNALPAPKGGLPLLLGLGIGFIALLIACYIYLLPALADLVAQKIPQSAEERLGQNIYKQLISTEDVDSIRTTYANQFLKQLRIPTSYPLHLTVVESETVNAFALPGGEMVVYTGLLNRLESPEEFVALLGHETAHVRERHTLRSLARNLSHYLFLSVLFNDVTGLSAILLENADKLKSLEYSRNLEEQADELGFQLLQANHLDPKGMQRLFERLQAGNAGSSSIPSILSTHPLTEERIKNLEEMVKENPYKVSSSPQLESIWDKLD